MSMFPPSSGAMEQSDDEGQCVADEAMSDPLSVENLVRGTPFAAVSCG